MSISMCIFNHVRRNASAHILEWQRHQNVLQSLCDCGKRPQCKHTHKSGSVPLAQRVIPDRNRRGSKGEVIHESRRSQRLEYRSDSPSASGAVTPEWKRWRWSGGRPTPSHRGREQTILTGSSSRRFARPLNHVCPARGARTPERAGTPPYPLSPRQKTPPAAFWGRLRLTCNSGALWIPALPCKCNLVASGTLPHSLPSRAPPDPPHRRNNQREQRSRSSEGVTALRPVTLQLVKISFDLLIILKQSNSAQTQTFPTPKWKGAEGKIILYY